MTALVIILTTVAVMVLSMMTSAETIFIPVATVVVSDVYISGDRINDAVSGDGIYDNSDDNSDDDISDVAIYDDIIGDG